MTSTTHGPWRNNFQHFTSCPAANDALQDFLQSTLDLVIEPVPVCFGGLAQALGLALQVFRDGLSQATSKRIPDLLAKRRLADLLEEDFNNFDHNPMSLNVVTVLECNIVIVMLFWEVRKAAEESLVLRVGGLHIIILILWYRPQMSPGVLEPWQEPLQPRVWRESSLQPEHRGHSPPLQGQRGRLR
ncbi:hypothetical protein BDZ91DRAFT_724952 [Kalaharituber pfeilii]|nr:hypothetical protein BDZ91DRAFT_724952 [Kalaharituber pfeilii]